MLSGLSTPPIELTPVEEQQLSELARSRSYPFGIVQWALIVLTCAEGQTNQTVANRFYVARNTAGKWRRRFLQQGVSGLHDATQPG